MTGLTPFLTTIFCEYLKLHILLIMFALLPVQFSSAGLSSRTCVLSPSPAPRNIACPGRPVLTTLVRVVDLSKDLWQLHATPLNVES